MSRFLAVWRVEFSVIVAAQVGCPVHLVASHLAGCAWWNDWGMTGQQEDPMSVFSDAEIEYLASQRLGRLATVGHDGMPHVVPVAFRYNPDADTIDIGGHDFAKRKKFRDVKRTGMAALVVDDVLPPQGLGKVRARLIGDGRGEWAQVDEEAGTGFTVIVR